MSVPGASVAFGHRQDMLQNGVSSRGQYVYFLMEFSGMFLLSAPLLATISRARPLHAAMCRA
jgi:hypothetical protein